MKKYLDAYDDWTSPLSNDNLPLVDDMQDTDEVVITRGGG